MIRYEEIQMKINEIQRDKLKHTLLGEEDYLFLINDNNNELDQHFNQDYKNLFNAEEFSEHYNFKKELFSKYNIGYYYFIVPDKSVVCRDLLPFDSSYLKRNIDLVEDAIDFTDCLTKNDYFKYDSHINYEGARKLTYKFINYIDNNFTIEEYNELINNADTHEITKTLDLVHEINWSYSDELKKNFPTTITKQVPKNSSLINKDIPIMFERVRKRKSAYLRNDDSYSDLRVLVLCGSSFNIFKNYLMLYFKELFFYWDHGHINPEVIMWFEPDIIIELRAERYLEKIPVPDYVSNKEELNLTNANFINKLQNKSKKQNNKIKQLKRELKKQNNKINQLKRELDNKDKKLNEILNSNSWKITKPLRKIRNR